MLVPVIATSFLLREDCLEGRASQSIAFFKKPEMDALYSGVLIISPSAVSTSFIKFATALGRGFSRSSLNRGRSEMSTIKTRHSLEVISQLS